MKQCPVCRGNLKYERVMESYPYQGKVVILEMFLRRSAPSVVNPC